MEQKVHSWSQFWRETKAACLNGFVGVVTPALLPEVSFASSRCIMTAFFCLEKHPEKAQQLSSIDSLIGLIRDVYRDYLK
jgi:hypothetical protein